MPKNKPAICQLSREYVEWIHDDLIGTLWPEIDPVSKREYRDVFLLESALGRPFHSAGGQDVYPTTIGKAAALFHSMIANHPFQNGNKRTAVLAVDIFLMANGYSLGLGQKEMYELAKKTASYKQQGISNSDVLQEIVDILKKWTITLSKMYRAQRKHPKLREVYRASLAMRRSVRKARINNMLQL